MNRPRVLFFHTVPFFAGGERFILELMTYLNKNGMAPFFLGRSTELRRRLRAAGIPAAYAPVPGVRRTLNPIALVRSALRLLVFTGRLVPYLRRNRVDLLYLNSWDAFLLVCLGAKLTRTPMILHCHEMVEPRPVTRAVFRAIGTWAEVLVGVSDAVAHHLVRRLGVPGDRVRRIHNGVDPARWPPARPGRRRPPVVVATAGRIGAHKGQHVFVECALRVLEKRTGVEFRIIGDAVEPEWKRYRDRLVADIERSGQAAMIRFEGWRSDCASALAPAAIVVVPSLFQDPFPYSVLEAMAMAKPVVASAVGGIPEMVVDGETGFIVPAGDPARLAEAVIALIDDPRLRRRMGAAARRRIESRFTVDRSCAEIAGIVRRASGGRSVRNRA